MRRGFTFIELMIASSISIVVFAALLVAVTSVWQLMKTSSDELQLSLQARITREKLMVKIDPTHDGLLGCNAAIEGHPAEKTGFNVWIARNERNADGSVVTNRFVIPADIKYLKVATPSEVGLTGNVVDKVYYREFLDFKFLPADVEYEPRLLRLNVYHHPTGTEGVILEDHPVFYMENGVW